MPPTPHRRPASRPLPPPPPPSSSPSPKKLTLTYKAAWNHDLALTRRDKGNIAKIRETTLMARARNTEKNYKPKQAEFIAWALKCDYQDRDTVTEAKLLSFLEEEVVHRPLRKKRKKALAADEIGLDQQVLAWPSVRNYATAITDLYNTQAARGMNSNPPPRAALAKDYIKALQRRDTDLAKQNYADKGRDTYLDGYSDAEFKDLCIALWKASSTSASPFPGRPPRPAPSPAPGPGPVPGPASTSTPSPFTTSRSMKTSCYLRTLVDQLLGHHLLARGNDRRVAEISDLHTFEFPDEGPTPCFPLIMTMRGSKTNQHGRLETMGALRNRDPFICPLSALAFYLLHRWDLTEEPFPDFTERSRWYNTRLLLTTRGDASSPLSYSSQLQWTTHAFELIGLCSTKKTHLPRGTSAKLAELKGVTEDQIMRAGRWTHDQMTGCYLTCLPLRFMRRMAGHSDRQGCFHIARADITPPDELLALIWPDLDRWKGKFGAQEGQIDDLAAGGFCTLLRHLRTVILQDSIPLREAFPDHPVWAHPVFHHDAYAAFAAQVKKACAAGDATPSLPTRIVEAVPDVADGLQSILARIGQESSAVKHQSTQDNAKWDAIGSDVELLKDVFRQLISGGLSFNLNNVSLDARLGRGQKRAPLAAQVVPVVAPATATAMAMAISPSISPSPSPSFLRPPPPQAPPQAPAQAPPQAPDLAEELLQSPAPPPPSPPPPPQYRMRRDVNSVMGLYREWTVGLQGCLSILELDRRYGPRWRTGRKDEIQFYSLRREIIREINHIAQDDGVSELTAMKRLQGRQDREQWSIDKLCKRLRVEARNRGRQSAYI